MLNLSLVQLPAFSAAFAASLVEVVEAFTIVLAVSVVRGWWPAALGTLAGLVLLVVLVLTLGPLLALVPIHILQLSIGVLLLLFGLRWLRKAMLRSIGVIAMHDEARIFERETVELRRTAQASADWVAGIAAFKAIVLEGVEVVFIVISVGAGHGAAASQLLPASLGAALACVLVLALGFALHRPLTKVPENTLKFLVGVMLSAFGVYWTVEGLGGNWPGQDLALLPLAVTFWLLALAGVKYGRKQWQISA
ncbi:MAG: TMEM165/GDT1 family protein [Hyphomicrobiales bacterium]|nr:TMEM165/GDT1 family protein [Hyphomicrobiales bacterium]MDE2114627.1 TMEM165/GDT1 family protein [Hyphomicrobiales bacterium]